MKKLAKAGVAAALTLVAVVGPMQAAHAEMKDVEYKCLVAAPSGPVTIGHNYVIDATAPNAVIGSNEFVVGLDHQLVQIEPQFLYVTDLQVKIAVSGARINNITLSGGVGVGDVPPHIEWSGGVATLTIPGPVYGGADFRMPKMTLRLSSYGPGHVVTTELAGTSFDDPGMTGLVTVPDGAGGTADLEKYCFPTAGKLLTRTLTR